MEQDGQTIALDLELSPELVRAGLAREAIRFIQETRKGSGLDVSDRISLLWSAADDELADAISQHAELIASEVLATSMTRTEQLEDANHDEDLGLSIRIAKA